VIIICNKIWMQNYMLNRGLATPKRGIKGGERGIMGVPHCCDWNCLLATITNMPDYAKSIFGMIVIFMISKP
jgi:hypothetical protein